ARTPAGTDSARTPRYPASPAVPLRENSVPPTHCPFSACSLARSRRAPNLFVAQSAAATARRSRLPTFSPLPAPRWLSSRTLPLYRAVRPSHCNSRKRAAAYRDFPDPSPAIRWQLPTSSWGSALADMRWPPHLALHSRTVNLQTVARIARAAQRV